MRNALALTRLYFCPFSPFFPLFPCRALNSAELPFGETPGSERILRGSFAQFVPDAQFPRGVAVADYLEMAYLACMTYMFSGARATVVRPDGYYPQRTAYLFGETHCFVYLYI